MKKWKQQAMALAPGLAWWQELRSDASKSPERVNPADRPLRCWVVFGMEGQGVELCF